MASPNKDKPKGKLAEGQPITTNECTLNYQRLLEHQYTLRKTLLPIKGTGLLFHVTHNLGLTDRELKSILGAIEEMENSVIRKDEKGRNIKFKAELKHQVVAGELKEFYEHVLDDNNQPIPLPFDSNEVSSPYYDRDSSEFQDAYKQLVEKEREITFETISKDRIKKLMDTNVIDGVDLSLIWGTIIV